MDTTTTTISPAERVGILLGPVGDLNTRVVRFLLLYLNTLQSSLEFEFVPEPPESALLTALASTKPVDRDHVRQLAGQFLADYQAYWMELREDYELLGTPPPRVIVLSTARFSDNYYVTSAGSVGVIALGNWERYMAPPSLVEFFIFVTLRTAVGLIDSRLYSSVHLGTKGCLWDFTPSLDDVRYKILVGMLCSQCRVALKEGPLSRLAEQLPQIMSKAWLGKREDPSRLPQFLLNWDTTYSCLKVQAPPFASHLWQHSSRRDQRRH